MFKSSAEMLSVQRQFQEVNSLLLKLVGMLSQGDQPRGGQSVQEVARLTEAVGRLEQGVNSALKSKQSQLGALMEIGRAINSSRGLNRVLEEVLDTLIKLMRAERGFLMLRKPSGELEVSFARGLARTELDKDDFAFSKTVVEKAVDTGDVVLSTNAQNDPRFGSTASVAAYQLRSLICAPLKLKDDLIGVIYVDNKAHIGAFQETDKELIAAFADQAAIAIDNARLIERLRLSNEDLSKANAELENAYQATLEGWVRALDLRDKETEGHTQRVTILTERLARNMGVEGNSLIQITRGALLHDIGKMAIPDGVLLKPGGLTDEERALVRKHPQYAHDMLYPIEFLRPALDIPYCHHERWDGTGYPRQLKAEEIPFAARIFPIIDVWDALVSDRPYRKGLPPEEVRERIKAESGRHFDPRVVAAFLEMEDLSV